MRFAIGRTVLRPEALNEAPPILRRVQNAAKAVARNVSSVAQGQPFLVSEEAKAARLAICQYCTLFDAQIKVCTHKDCGCYMKAKAWLNAEKCPAGKW